MEAPAAPRDPAESFESPKPFESSESSDFSDFSGSSDFSESSRSFESAPGVEITVTSPEQMRELGRRLATVLRAGDLLMLSGELGAGKTTLTRGLGEGMGVRGAVTSPTFVIARVHPSLGDGPPLVHVDAYRLSGGLDEMEDLDLDVSLPDSVIVVEWGEGKVEELTDDRLRLRIDRAVGDTTDEVRHVTLTGIGERWAAADLSVLAV
ncbi:tRNA (adenosine(37)-N6)-threonylcarbamoyltransferase complex ATPase subunit type 1 TsaE [Streptomyces sp. DH41]|uniref:tRNA (adenosine(37)-N6)-threonylcarbamoyltransferase complex ATPase subunit type 1 TsaE n=1 Tax=Streptomyces sp. DH41 TaxID=3040125 RepID=UPI003FA6D4F8